MPPPNRRKTDSKKPGLSGRFVRGFARIVLLGVLLLVVGITSLRWIDPLTSSIMFQHNLHSLINGYPRITQRWVDWENISKQLPLAVISAEDQRFPSHRGIDFTELEKAIEGGGQRGASTISQQVAKNMFLWQGRSFLRKVIEAPLALYIDLVWGKQRVMEVYLNIAFFGENIYGVGRASEVYFDKSASDINRYEAARMAAILPNPHRFSATNSSNYIVKRQRWIMKQMKQLGGTTYLENL